MYHLASLSSTFYRHVHEYLILYHHCSIDLYCCYVNDDDCDYDGCANGYVDAGEAMCSFRCVSDTHSWHCRRSVRCSSVSEDWAAVDLASSSSPNNRRLKSEDHLAGVIVLLYS